MTTEKPTRPIVEPTFGEKMETWYDRNGNWINIIMIVVLVGIIGYKAYDYMENRNIARANTAYGIAGNQFMLAQQNPDETKKIDQLQGAVTAAQQVAIDHRDQYVGRLAQLMIANAQYTIASTETGQDVKTLERTRDSFRSYIEMAESNTEKAAGYIGLGNVLENLSFIQSSEPMLKEAEAAYTEALSAADGTYLGAEAKLALARIKQALNAAASKAEAETLLNEVIEDGQVQLVSDDDLENVQPIEVAENQTLSVEEVKELKNLAKWSHRQLAQDALAGLK